MRVVSSKMEQRRKRSYDVMLTDRLERMYEGNKLVLEKEEARCRQELAWENARRESVYDVVDEQKEKRRERIQEKLWDIERRQGKLNLNQVD